MSAEIWNRVDDYLEASFGFEDPVLAAARVASTAAGLPEIAVSAREARFLALLATMAGARRILEIGTLGGYSAIALARVLPADGRLVTLEFSPKHADVARANLAAAGLADRAEVRIGAAIDTLAALRAEAPAPFDFVFIDADKENYPAYLEAALALVHPGAVIVADNVIREGAVADASSADPRVAGTREYLARLAAEPRFLTTVIQSVGRKGYDGMAISVVRSL